jgi:hypothetical protein
VTALSFSPGSSSVSDSESDSESTFSTGLTFDGLVGVFDGLALFELTVLADFDAILAPISGSGGGVGGLESSRSINRSSSESGNPPGAISLLLTGSGSSAFCAAAVFDADLLEVVSFFDFLEDDSGTKSLASSSGAAGGGGGTGGADEASSFNFVSPWSALILSVIEPPFAFVDDFIFIFDDEAAAVDLKLVIGSTSSPGASRPFLASALSELFSLADLIGLRLTPQIAKASFDSSAS